LVLVLVLLHRLNERFRIEIYDSDKISIIEAKDAVRPTFVRVTLTSIVACSKRLEVAFIERYLWFPDHVSYLLFKAITEVLFTVT
jgi:hypothetical protein